jgi:hypothetical protein
MSRRPGRIERSLVAIFEGERDNAFTTHDLCERIWPDVYQDSQAGRIERRHRSSVIRAARNIARQRPEIQWLHGERLGRELVFFRHDEVMSYAMARLKADRFQRYRGKDPRLRWRDKEGALRRELSEGSHRELIRPGGAWHRQVEIFLTDKGGHDPHSRGFSLSSVIERPLFRVAHLVLLLIPYGTGRVTNHALNAGEGLFQRRAVGQFCSKPALNMWYGSAVAARRTNRIRNGSPYGRSCPDKFRKLGLQPIVASPALKEAAFSLRYDAFDAKLARPWRTLPPSAGSASLNTIPPTPRQAGGRFLAHLALTAAFWRTPPVPSPTRERMLRADSAPTGIASGRTGVLAKAVIPLRARNSLHRQERAARS